MTNNTISPQTPPETDAQKATSILAGYLKEATTKGGTGNLASAAEEFALLIVQLTSKTLETKKAAKQRIYSLATAGGWSPRSKVETAAMHGSAWAKEDDQALHLAWESDATPTASALGERFGRSKGAIIARLVHIGLFADRDAARLADQARQK